ncbi:type VI secretion system lipoprotein TssJ [Pokkaliibacter sp. MBI-7]|uniref:type VI secretion system lipoprotein TssJ n=1 Tax=Pokkaliibacter sp. MBI-7 TaxID=3040600 RepID=UPI0024497486|nr:type VI secretion system lipoprotein TssJ [Pokkaliibacter sp. MBI-7]MDH2432934.1 type VI secretion system lipoprotein TssJ [Pokkaliibacter sp. MBI-7]
MSTTVRLFCMAWLAAVALLSGCSTVNSVVPPSTDLDFKVSKQVNPDPSGRASPLVVRIYELSSRSVFDSQDFFALYDNPDQVLSQDMLSKDELVLEPGSKKTVTLRLDRKTRYIAVMAAFRDIENARWRDVVVADPEGYDDFDVNIEKLSITLRD